MKIPRSKLRGMRSLSDSRVRGVQFESAEVKSEIQRVEGSNDRFHAVIASDQQECGNLVL